MTWQKKRRGLLPPGAGGRTAAFLLLCLIKRQFFGKTVAGEQKLQFALAGLCNMCFHELGSAFQILFGDSFDDLNMLFHAVLAALAEFPAAHH